MTWQPKRDGLPGREVLKGQTVSLVPMAWPEPAGALTQRMVAEPEELWRYMGIGPFPDLDSFHAMLLASRDKDVDLLAICPHGESPAGMAAFMRMKPEFGVAEIGTVAYSARLQRSREGTEAIYLMLKHLFEDFGWRRAEWICNAENEKSFRAGQRYGFTYEGTFRQHRWVKGANRDTAWLAMLDHEWRYNKAVLETWLEPPNFDGGGTQIRSIGEIRQDLDQASK